MVNGQAFDCMLTNVKDNRAKTGPETPKWPILTAAVNAKSPFPDAQDRGRQIPNTDV